LTERVFVASLAEFRRGAGVLAGRIDSSEFQAHGGRSADAGRDVEGSLTGSLRLASLREPGASPRRNGGRRGWWTRLAPLTALAAAIGVAALVTTPGMVVALQSQAPKGAPPAIFAASEDRAVLPVLAALLQRDASGSWAGVSVTSIDASFMKPLESTSLEAPEVVSGRGAASPMIPIVEAHETDFTDIAEEFARIRDAASSARAAPVSAGRL
jgi:hypothetical protein